MDADHDPLLIMKKILSVLSVLSVVILWAGCATKSATRKVELPYPVIEYAP